MGLLLALGSACAQNAVDPVEEAYQELEQAISGGQAEACRQAKARCLDAIDKAIKQRQREVAALKAKIGADVNKETAPTTVLARSIIVLEQELAGLAAKEARVNAVACDQLD